MTVQGSQSRLGQGRGLAAEAPRMGRGPTFLLLTLPADQKHTRDPCSCHVTRGGGVESAILGLPGRRMVPGKQRKREGGR